MTTVEGFYFMCDVLGLVAVVVMLHLTEDHMTDLPTETMEQRIHAMLDDAMANDYDISTWTADDIVADLRAYADLTEDETDEAIKPHVITWKQKRGVLT